MNKAVIGLGSNINPAENITKAREILAGQFTILSESDFVETKPVGFREQSDFINGALLIETDMTLTPLKDSLKKLETLLGREKSDIPCGPRTIDLDIVVFNDDVVDGDFYDREFLKKSVLKLLPELQY